MKAKMKKDVKNVKKEMKEMKKPVAKKKGK